MREIKFRGKRVDNGEWVYGMLGTVDDFYFISDDSLKPCGYDYAYGINPMEIDHNTVGQYTGLRDIENNVDVFDKDVVKIHQFLFDGNEIEREVTGLVEYSDELSCWCISHINDLQMCRHMGYESTEEAKNELIPICSLYGLHEMSFTVIGNIHDGRAL